ncbi:hypothetical protein RRG08_033266 [Elysia crispata]|uniref:Uncharacterized protein n=1 Tax=Elysia crispata TaxID=231223 RepID=A0AAE0XQY0_9GAST|nr:hypothetical protein RRG08_033266 [Elysia crispata]
MALEKSSPARDKVQVHVDVSSGSDGAETQVDVFKIPVGSQCPRVIRPGSLRIMTSEITCVLSVSEDYTCLVLAHSSDNPFFEDYKALTHSSDNPFFEDYKALFTHLIFRSSDSTWPVSISCTLKILSVKSRLLNTDLPALEEGGVGRKRSEGQSYRKMAITIHRDKKEEVHNIAYDMEECGPNRAIDTP